MAVVKLHGRVNRPLALLGAVLVYVGKWMVDKSVTIKPIGMNQRVHSGAIIDWRKRRARA